MMQTPQSDKSSGVSASDIQVDEACILHLADHLGHTISRAGLRDSFAATHAREDTLSRKDLIKAAIVAAERAGMRTALGRRSIDHIELSVLPAVVFPKNGAALVLHGKRKENFIAHDPKLGAGLIELTPDTISAWSAAEDVHVLSFKPELSDYDPESGQTPHRHWFRSALMANSWAYTQVAIAAAVVNLLALVVSLFTMVVYDRILPTGATDSLLVLAFGVSIALAFDFIIKTLRAGFIDHAGQQVDLTIGQRLFNHIVDIEMSARRRSVGEVAASMREMENLRDFFTSATMTAVVDLPFVCLFVGVIYIVAGPLALIPIMAVPLVLLIGILVQPRLKRLSDRILSEGQTKQSVLVETLTGIETIKTVGAIRQMRARWDEAMRRQSQFSVKSRVLTQFAINATGFVQQAAQVGIIVYGALLVMAGEITSGVLIAAVILTGRALAPLGLISQTLTRYHQAQSAYVSLNTLMATPSERPSGKTWMTRKRLTGEIHFKNLTFCYPDQDKAALDGIDFTISAGERVAFMGAVGSGKSTIARLLLGLYAPQEGVVQVDGVDVRQFDPTELRRNFGVVLQDNWMISGTLRENIALGSFLPTDDQILQAARLSGVETFAAVHPDGYNMRLSENGGGLSGGQRQMVALARALLSNPPILVLDEATAAMDTKNEAQFIHNLKSTLKGRTLLVMTHRQSMLELVDRVIVLKDGKIHADGTRKTSQKDQMS